MPNTAPAPPVVWIVSTGTEILQGHYADANAPWLSAQLLQLGLTTLRHMALPDEPEALRRGLRDAALRADLVIVTGGLGPTEDDLGREIMAEVWARPLEESPEALAQIDARFRQRSRIMHPGNRRQALLPSGAVLIPNAHGTAPGFFIPPDRERALSGLIALPGPPRENRPMFLAECAGHIRQHWPAPAAQIAMFHTVNLPESVLNDRICDLFGADPHTSVALLFSLGFVDVRLLLTHPDPQARAAALDRWRELLTERLGGENIYGIGEETLASVVAERLRETGQTLSVAESCTGGLLAAALTDLPGASDYFLEGFVTYANAAKTARLGVDPDLIARHGAVSAPVAAAMAQGARKATGADWALATTGVAGPGGGTADKPVGLVWFGLARPDGTVETWPQHFLGGRAEVRQRAVQAALDALRRAQRGLSRESPVPAGERTSDI